MSVVELNPLCAFWAFNDFFEKLIPFFIANYGLSSEGIFDFDKAAMGIVDKKRGAFFRDARNIAGWIVGIGGKKFSIDRFGKGSSQNIILIRRPTRAVFLFG